MVSKAVQKAAIILLIGISILGWGCSKSEKGTPTPPPWTAITGNQFNMIVLGSIFRNGTQINEGFFWVGSCGPGGIDTDCRSVSAVSDSGAFYATVRGNTNGDQIRFIIWDGYKRQSYTASESISFKADDTKTGFNLNFDK